ncbi:hypothetical protein RDV64_00370 [Acuticoccus sp. MNP-M23]|uniref:hypothetical protein n=1 Tax=Acuticoccus sp. MNP-M23 TaxID=3072793 RepID=UPI002815B8E3|nr:hypothetical protein [Acuticoccus sp. MNP-M23]WMS42892.1 hypothetical protein RDV64_00370 [Acuticoccus sp. MNP-M23]
MGMIPFTLIPLVLYGFAAIFLYDHSNYVVEPGQVALHPFWDKVVAGVTLVSGQSWALTYGDLLIVIALMFLLFSMLRSASTTRTTVIGNMVMVLVLCAYIVLFLTVSFAGTSIFFLLMVITLVDTLATVSISMVASHSRMDAVPD